MRRANPMCHKLQLVDGRNITYCDKSSLVLSLTAFKASLPSFFTRTGRMSMDDQAYYRKRALQEQAAVRNATCDEARERHAELAAAYDLRSRLLQTIEVRRAFQPVIEPVSGRATRTTMQGERKEALAAR